MADRLPSPGVGETGGSLRVAPPPPSASAEELIWWTSDSSRVLNRSTVVQSELNMPSISWIFPETWKRIDIRGDRIFDDKPYLPPRAHSSTIKIRIWQRTVNKYFPSNFEIFLLKTESEFVVSWDLREYISVPKCQDPFPLILVQKELGAVSESLGPPLFRSYPIRTTASI